MAQKQTTDMDDWEEIGEQAQKAREELFKLHELLGGGDAVPKTVWRDAFEKADGGLSALKSDLEDRMVEEHPDEFDTDVFYGGDY
ncbi:hypothetical protein C449_07740 [Halococcus saccharolyticus DSM 5350]|uniref:Uncharacterized protein n=2 Tax=Halococcus saccharolyticus TaxID=62319 RepID=M0MM52_9EURY|nr:hypothetical protein C449_07740 [Halococcus saccharolyticus DSM 5350]